MLNNEMPVISSNLSPGSTIYGGVYATCDPFNSALPNNGALNPLGSVWTIPSLSQGGGYAGTYALGMSSSGAITHTLNGYGSFLTVKYVRYKSTSNPAMVAGPAPVYYTDGTFTTVTGKYSEGNPAATGEIASIAGWLLVNPATASATGTGMGSLISATILNGNYVFIGVQGFIPACYITDTTNVTGVGQGLMGDATSNSGLFATTLVTTINRVCGYTWAGPASTNLFDVVATCGIF
jgi:hypothetical protein